VVAVDRRPGAGETVLGGDTVVLPGGKGANLAVAAARIGADTALLGALGADGHGDILLASLEKSGVRTELVRVSDRPTGAAYITVTPDGENSIVVAPGANASVSAADVRAAAQALSHAKVVAGSLEVPVEAIVEAVRIAARHGVRAMVNLSPVAALPQDALDALDPLVVNEHEAAWLLGSSEVTAEKLLALGPRSVVITLGSAGSIVAERGQETVTVPAIPATPVDTTGAGDNFAGALAARLAAGDCLVTAAKFASKSAAISVTRPGAQPSYPTAAEVSEQ
jgi:ribokinase